MDSGYTTLLTHLHSTKSTLPLSALHSSIAYYLAHAPSPTALAASAASSPRFQAHDHSALAALSAAFERATLARFAQLQNEGASVFTRSVRTRLNAWARDVLEGIRAASPAVKLACAGGLLTGVDGVQRARGGVSVSARGKAEDEVLVALAEVLDVHARRPGGGWEVEFAPAQERLSEGVLHDTLALAAPFLSLVPTRKLRALPLSLLATVLTSTITSTFKSDDGTFLSGASALTRTSLDTPLEIAAGSRLSENIGRTTTSAAYAALPALSKLLARTVSLLADSKSTEGWDTTNHTLASYITLNTLVEADWASSPLSSITSDDAIAPSSRELTAKIWTALKSLLFSTLMLSHSVLSAASYPSPSRPPSASPASHARAILLSLYPLSFVLARLGGFSAPAESRLTELQRAAFGALDVLAADPLASRELVKELCENVDVGTPTGRARAAVALVCVEQLVSVLGEEEVVRDVLPMCLPFLDDAKERETFEAAHSTMLAVFAARASRLADTSARGADDADDGFAARLVPAYAASLVNNAGPGRLSAHQLSLASAALVRAAGATNTPAGGALALFVIDALSRARTDAAGTPRARDLALALVACISAAPARVVVRVLEEARRAAEGLEEEERGEGVRGVFEEVLRVGEGGKGEAMRWWEGWAGEMRREQARREEEEMEVKQEEERQGDSRPTVE